MENFIEDCITLLRVIYCVHCYCMYVIYYIIIIILLRALMRKSSSGKLLNYDRFEYELSMFHLVVKL